MRSDRYRQRVTSHAARGEYGAALAALDAWRVREPGSLEPELLRARIDYLRGDLRESARCVLEAVRARECPPDLVLDLVQSLRVLVEHDALTEWASTWPHRARLSPADLARVAASLDNIGAHALATEWIEEAVARAPEDAACRVNRALLRSYAGDFEGSLEDADRAISTMQDPAIAHWIAARLERASRQSNRVARLRARLQDADSLDAEYLQFALFKQLDELGESEDAWHALEAGCQLVRSRMPYGREATERLFSALMRHFPLNGPVAPLRSGAPTSIFIVGMHRCGSTLLESMLAAHPQVCAYGESQRLSGALRHAANHPCVALADETLVASAGAGLDTRARPLPRRRPKSHPRRIPCDRKDAGDLPADRFHPPCVAASKNHPFATRSDGRVLCQLARAVRRRRRARVFTRDLAHYHGLYSKLMRHWHAIYPGFVLDIDYEDLVRDPVATSRRVYDFCGLAWREEVVDPASWSSRSINTLSSVQARQRVYTSSVGRWRRYARQLEPLREALNLRADA
jgi:tetratricopeptide (TPR) repeat protein